VNDRWGEHLPFHQKVVISRQRQESGGKDGGTGFSLRLTQVIQTQSIHLSNRFYAYSIKAFQDSSVMTANPVLGRTCSIIIAPRLIYQSKNLRAFLILAFVPSFITLTKTDILRSYRPFSS